MRSERSYLPDVQHGLDRFRGEAKQIIDSFVSTLPKELPPIIYHYTNDVGLRGILESGKVWLTDIFKLNDPSEVHHGLSHAIGILRRKVENGPPQTKKFVGGLEAFFRQGGVEKAAHFFICSFSSCGDDLGQWRAYGDNGRGYALGFDANVLENGLRTPNAEAFYLTYDDNKLDALLGQIVESYRSAVNLDLILRSGVGAHEMADLYTWLTVYLLRAALFFKHAAYATEKEYRFLESYGADAQPPDVKLRARSYSLVEYREFDWRGVAAGALKRIVAGPAADHQEAARFATDCLRSCNAESVVIIRSGIPYRAV